MAATTGSPDAGERTVSGAEPVQRASLVAGTGLLATAVLAVFGNVLAVESLVVPGDATQTATNIQSAAGLFRLGIASLLVVAGLDVVVAWALYTIFEPANRRLSRAAAWFRLVYAGVFVVAISHLLAALRILTDPAYGSIYTTEQRHALASTQIGTFGDVWTAGLAIFAIHLLLLAYLTYDAAYTPNYLAVLLPIAGLGYLVDSLGAILVQGYSVEVAAVTFVGEVVLVGWLLVRGRSIELQSRGQGSRN